MQNPRDRISKLSVLHFRLEGVQLNFLDMAAEQRVKGRIVGVEIIDAVG
jgi:hypothetical protein